MTSSDTDDDIIISSALLVASVLLSTIQTVTKINNWHLNKHLTNHSSGERARNHRWIEMIFYLAI